MADEQREESGKPHPAPAAPSATSGDAQKEDPKQDAKQDAKQDQDGYEGRPHPFGWVSLLVIAALIVGTFFVVNALMDDTKMQDCIQSGRRNCAPVDPPVPQK